MTRDESAAAFVEWEAEHGSPPAGMGWSVMGSDDEGRIVSAELVPLPGVPLASHAMTALPAVVGLALRETVRTPAEQDALLALAKLVANPMWPAGQEAEATWKHSPCERCGWRIPPGDTRCLSVLCRTEAP